MTIKDIIAPFDSLLKKDFDESDVAAGLKQQLSEGKELDGELKADIMAFEFMEDYHDEESGWGTYFGPTGSWKDNEGQWSGWPSIKEITAETLIYWEKRATESKNPILTSRYYGLVWDFKEKITGTKPSHEICKQYIKSLIDVANGDFHDNKLDGFTKLKRALSLALSYKFTDLITQAKDAIICFEEKNSIDDYPGLWGYSFDLLIDAKNVELTSEEEDKIIDELEQKLSRLTSPNDKGRINIWAAENAAERLATYYKSTKTNGDVKRVILKLANAHDKTIDAMSAMQASAQLNDFLKLYKKFGLNAEADAIILKIRELEPKAASELTLITDSITVPKEFMENYVAEMTSGDMQDVLKRIANRYIPIYEKAKDEVLNSAKRNPWFSSINQNIHDEGGRVIATIGSVEEDLEGNIARRISENLSYDSIGLGKVLRSAIEKRGLDGTAIIDFTKKYLLIGEKRRLIVERALDAYFQNDYLVFIHLLIPQLEEIIRSLIEDSGENVLKQSKGGGFHLKTFDKILSDAAAQKRLDKDLAFYLKVLYTDSRGWNLRNDVCHGLASYDKFNAQTADWVLHSLLCLGLLKKE